MLIDAYRDERPGIRIAYTTDGHFLNQRHMHFQSRVFTITVHKLLFADDCALNATLERDMQNNIDLFSAAAAACEIFGLIINTEKTMVMHKPPSNSSSHSAPQISVNRTHLQVVDNFTYPDSTLSRSTKIDDEVAHWISKANHIGKLGNLAQDRLTWRRTVKIGEAIYEDNRNAAAKAKRKTRISHLPPPPPQNTNAQSPPTCPRCQQTFRSPIRLVGHLRTNCSTRTAPTVVCPFTSPSLPTPSTDADRPPEPLLQPSSSSSSSSSSSTTTTTTTSTSTAVPSVMSINITHNPNTPKNANFTTVNTIDNKRVYICPHYDRTFTSHNGLLGHLRIHRTETGGPTSGAPTYTR
ncbi:hypothetical protein SprV_0200769700 [Sparganum proliferum]